MSRFARPLDPLGAAVAFALALLLARFAVPPLEYARRRLEAALTPPVALVLPVVDS